MEFTNLTEEEFTQFAKDHPLVTFHQTTEWAALKRKNGWIAHYVGLKKEQQIKAATLLLAKDTPIKKKMFYSPRGYLLDFKDRELLTIFTKKITEYIQKENGFFLKIDPYVMHQVRDIDGNIVTSGINNQEIITTLKELGYKHFGFNLYQDTLQPRWMHTLNVKDKTIEVLMKDMDPKTRQIIRKNEKCAIHTREITKEELPKFKEVMQTTSDRRDFVDRPLSYYENMWDSLHESGILKILLAEIDFEEYIETLKKEHKQLQDSITERRKKKAAGQLKVNEKKFEDKIKVDEKELVRLEKKEQEINALKEQYGKKAVLGGILFLIYGKEVLSLYGGSFKELMQFQSAYTLHWEMIKYALEKGYDRYNFYGITGDFREENPLYGLYLFKRGFGGQVTELIGEFDIVINKPAYLLYKAAFKTYHTLKNRKKR